MTRRERWTVLFLTWAAMLAWTFPTLPWSHALMSFGYPLLAGLAGAGWADEGRVR